MTSGLLWARWLALLIPAGLLAGAYAGQYGFDLYPCEMCWWQRYPHFAALVPAAAAFFVGGKVRCWLIIVAALAIAISGAIGVLHAGVEYHWWQGPTTCSMTAGGATLDDLLNAPLIRCDTAQWTLFGVSLAGYNAIASLGGAALIGWLLSRTEQQA